MMGLKDGGLKHFVSDKQFKFKGINIRALPYEEYKFYPMEAVQAHRHYQPFWFRQIITRG